MSASAEEKPVDQESTITENDQKNTENMEKKKKELTDMCQTQQNGSHNLNNQTVDTSNTQNTSDVQVQSRSINIKTKTAGYDDVELVPRTNNEVESVKGTKKSSYDDVELVPSNNPKVVTFSESTEVKKSEVSVSTDDTSEDEIGMKAAYSQSDLLECLDDDDDDDEEMYADASSEQESTRDNGGADKKGDPNQIEKKEMVGKIDSATGSAVAHDKKKDDTQVECGAGGNDNSTKRDDENKVSTLNRCNAVKKRASSMEKSDKADSISKRDSLQSVDVKKIISDISGRFHVDGAQYMDTQPDIPGEDGTCSYTPEQTEDTQPTLEDNLIYEAAVDTQEGDTQQGSEYENPGNIYDDVDELEERNHGDGAGFTDSPGEPPHVAQAANTSTGSEQGDADGLYIETKDISSGQESLTASIKSDRSGHYEPVNPSVQDADDEGSDYTWGSSEFESFDEGESGEEERPRVEMRKKKNSIPRGVQYGVRKSTSDPTQLSSTVLDKLAAKLGQKSKKEEKEDDMTSYIEVVLNLEKHPAPELPPEPANLDHEQTKRRHIVANIVESEKSYMSALQRIIEDYEKPLLENKSQILSKSTVRIIFFKLRDILQCHNMFHIELSEAIHWWDRDEKIGNVFTASFSKAMVFDVYSAFINNFSGAMETAKKAARQKQVFADFLKQREKASVDKLSLFGLMVKPVQRFPQFILLLQDLLKHTPKDHYDRLALQLALTELENLTHKLNETKRESESRHSVKTIFHKLTGRYFTVKPDSQRYLVRQDDMLQMDTSATAGERKMKQKRLFMMSDQLMCVSVICKETDSGITEKYKFKWSIPIRDVQVNESATMGENTYKIKGGPGRTTIIKSPTETSGLIKKELDDLLHDHSLMVQISQLVSQLRLSHQDLNQAHVDGLAREIQRNIQQKDELDWCTIQLCLPVKYLQTVLQTSRDRLKNEVSKHIKHTKSKTVTGRGNARMLHTFQVASPSVKQEWLLELQNTKLALDPNNNPGWSVPESEQRFTFKLPLFIKPLLIDITKQDTKVHCAIPVLLPSIENSSVGIQHLWVCSGHEGRGQVTIVSLHTNQPHVVESFKACDHSILCAEMVPGYALCDDTDTFPHDTVWMSTTNREIHICRVVDAERQGPLQILTTEEKVTCLRFMDGCLYAGTDSGSLLIYHRDLRGRWDVSQWQGIQLGPGTVTCLLSVNHEMWVACGDSIWQVKVVVTAGSHDEETLKVTKNQRQICGAGEAAVQCMVRAGAGLMVAFEGQSVMRLYHLETFQHLQDVNIGSAVNKMTGKGEGPAVVQDVSITYLLASKGLMWVGTDVGCVLTVPLPRLEGVPQIKGRPSISYHAHCGPIKFLVPIHCGITQLHEPVSPSSYADDNVFPVQDESQETIEEDGSEDAVQFGGESGQVLMLEGVTETESEDHLGFVSSDVVYPTTQYLDSENSGTLQSRWTSTPDLRLADEENIDDVNSLYGSLLRGSEDYMDVESWKGHPKNRKGTSDEPYLSLVATRGDVMRYHQSISRSRQTNPRSKSSTLPILMEDCPVYETSDRKLSMPEYHEQKEEDIPFNPTASVGDTVSIHSHRSHSYAQRPQVLPQALSKSVIVVSGGDGHINFSKSAAKDMQYEDLCLLLWQCHT